jgi:putative MFS transporter
MKEALSRLPFTRIVLVAALGYFVDIYDLVLFGMERVASLHDLLKSVYPNDEVRKQQVALIGSRLLSYQMSGMLIGGIFWGILGDRKGRLSVLFGSIIVYSLANIANGLVNDTFWYAVLRFVSGFGLAGELGAGVTLVSETMHREKRGIGTMVVATIGLFGAVVAGFTTIMLNNWRISYYIGGAMGLLLLFLRIGVFESGMYSQVKTKAAVQRGNFFYLFSKPHLLMKYLSIILIAVPVWFVMYFLVQFSPEMIRALGGTNGPGEGKLPIMVAYIGITIGDVASGLLSQRLQSRKKVLLLFITFTLLFSIVYYLFADLSGTIFYVIVFCIGFATGYWAVFMSSAAELFGTNIRATVTTTAPNFVRGTVTLMTVVNTALMPSFGLVKSSLIIGGVVFALAYFAIFKLEETFNKELNYTE